jgi:hypothetical protein
MTDVPIPALIPYSRFLEVRARRLEIVTELTQPDGQRTTNITMPSAPVAIDERARLGVRVLATGPAAGVQQS